MVRERGGGWIDGWMETDRYMRQRYEAEKDKCGVVVRVCVCKKSFLQTFLSCDAYCVVLNAES